MCLFSCSDCVLLVCGIELFVKFVTALLGLVCFLFTRCAVLCFNCCLLVTIFIYVVVFDYYFDLFGCWVGELLGWFGCFIVNLRFGIGFDALFSLL